MTLKNRLAKLEKRSAAQLSWKEFIGIDAAGMGELIKMDPNFAAAWAGFISDGDQVAIARAWADTFTADESARVFAGDIGNDLATKLLSVPDVLKPVLDRLEGVIANEKP